MAAITQVNGKAGRFYEVEGRMLPSVTHILQVIGKPALVQWAAKEERLMVMESAADLYADIHGTPKMSRPTYLSTLDGRIGKTRANQKLLQAAGEIGKQVHALVEWNIRQSLQQKVGPEPKVDEKALWAFMSWQDWAKSVNLKPLLIEQAVFSLTHGYAGTMDLLAEVNGLVTLVDFKTGKAVYNEAHLQNVAYQVALTEMGHLKPEQGMIVRLPKNEKDPGFEAVVCPPVDELLPTFLATKKLWEWWFAGEQAYHEKREAQKQEPSVIPPPPITPEPEIPAMEQAWIRIKELSEAKGMSKEDLAKWIKKTHGVTPKQLPVLLVQGVATYLTTLPDKAVA
jgi:hypothetical protein